MSDHRITVSARYGGQLMQNVLHFKNTDGALSPAALANNVLVNWVRKVKLCQTSDCNNFAILVQNLSAPTTAAFNLPISEPGTQPSEHRMPTFVSAVFKYSTAFAGRHGRGRSFIPGVPTDFVFDWQLSPAGIVNYQTNVVTPIVAAFVSGGVAGMPLCVREHVPGSGTDILHEVIAIAVRQQLGVQRRRNIGIGV
jgi:hypothetical protein